MNNKLDNLKTQLRGAISRFADVLRQPKNEYIRDSSIQRFEFTFELTWKTLKAVLEDRGIKVYSPKDALKGAFQLGLIKDDRKWLEMLETRNLTSHVYNENMAEKIFANLPSYLPLLKDLLKNLE